MFDHDAEILDHVDSLGSQAAGALAVEDAQLHPYRRRGLCQGKDFIDVSRDVGGGPKQVHDVDGFGDFRERPAARLSQRGLELGVHRKDSIAALLQVAGDPECVFAFLVLDAHHGDVLCRRQDGSKFVVCVRHPCASFLGAWPPRWDSRLRCV